MLGLGLLVLRHVRGALGRVGIRVGIGRLPRVERDLELGPEPPLGNRHRVLVAGDVRGEPRVERRGVEVAVLHRQEIRAARLRASSRRLREQQSRLRAPLRRSEARPAREERDRGEEHGLDDADQIRAVLGPRMALCSAISLPTSAAESPSPMARHPTNCGYRMCGCLGALLGARRFLGGRLGGLRRLRRALRRGRRLRGLARRRAGRVAVLRRLRLRDRRFSAATRSSTLAGASGLRLGRDLGARLLAR